MIQRRSLTLGVVSAFLIAVLGVAPAMGQALPSLSSLRVRYNTQKTTAKPDGELKVQIDQVDKDLAEATRLGRNGDVRRLLAKGMVLLAGRPWTDADEFQSALVLRTDAIVIDPVRPATVRLEQIFAPAVALARPLTAVATIRPVPVPGAAPPPTPAPATQVGTFDNVARDLRESPLVMDLNLSAIADGPQILEVSVKDGDQALGAATLRMTVQKGLDVRLRQLDAADVPAAVRADVRYPADYIRKVNRGLVELGGFNVSAELSAAEAVVALAKGGKDPFVGKTGGFERHYVFEAAGEIMPYRVYVPTTYNGSRSFPLIVALHGLGANEDSFMDSYNKTVPTLAEQRGYIVVSPLGFRIDGFYGFNLSGDAAPADRRRVQLSEQDVMEVLQRVRAAYKIDEARVYLMGHSMGAIGTWAIAAKHPSIWAATGAFAGLGVPSTVEAMRHIPHIVVHGDADATVNVSGSRNMVAAMKKLDVDHIYIEVAGGNHIDVVVPNLPAVFDFFDKKRKANTTSQDLVIW
jgi:poly(3-hydroxybutyrate) depolymerase